MSSSRRGALVGVALLGSLLLGGRGDAPAFRILAFGGSVGPDQTPLALERALRPLDAAGARPADVLLFGSGRADWPSVMTEPAVPEYSLREELGRVMGQGANLGVRYRPTLLRGVDGAAGLQDLLAAVRQLSRTAERGPGLLVVGVGHGELAADGAGSELALWGADRLRVEELVSALDGSGAHATVALILGHCFGGDFARIAFEAADPARPTVARCGLFASPPDRLADGCGARVDDGPSFVERAAQALAAGEAPLDLDHDGGLSLRELHLALSRDDPSINVPTLSSQVVWRLLRDSAEPIPLPTLGEVVAAADPLQASLLQALARRLAVDERSRLDDVRQRVGTLQDALDRVSAQRQLIEDAQEARRLQLVDRIAERWPALLNAYRRDFAQVLQAAEPELEALLAQARDDPEAQALDDEWQQLERWQDASERELAGALRLLAAAEDAWGLARLARDDEGLWQALQPVLACERRPLVPLGG